MVRGWFGRDEPSSPAPIDDPLPGEFLILDQRLSAVSAGIGTAVELGQAADLEQRFRVPREHAYAAVEAYMAIAGLDRPVAVHPQQRVDVLNRVRAAIAELDAFYERNRVAIESANQQRRQLPERARQLLAVVDAELTGGANGTGANGTGAPGIVTLRSVSQARATVTAARDALRTALASESMAGINRGIAEVERALPVLRNARERGATIAETTGSALRSVRTRREAVLLRQSRVPAVMSSLYREFSAECSADLTHNAATALERINRAGALIDRAAAALADDPELAAELVASARDELTDAERLVDAVTDRLDELQAVRADPRAVLGKTRFRIRDAQLLAVHSGLVKEWGTVLDAQSARVDRATAKLERIHPDYWAYLTELRSIDEFVRTTVAKMQGQRAASGR